MNVCRFVSTAPSTLHRYFGAVLDWGTMDALGAAV
jgi:hypothetical protein